MREQVIFDSRLSANIQTVFDEIERFRLDNFYAYNIEVPDEIEGNRHVWVIYPQGRENSSRIINGYIDIIPLGLDPDSGVYLRIVSCRYELDLLFFQLSQRVQAKCLIPEFLPQVLTTPINELVEQGVLSPNKISLEELINNPKSAADTVEKYGTERNLTLTQVCNLVKRCREFMKRDGTIEAFYNLYVTKYCTLGTFKDWMKNKKFNPPKKTP